MNKGGITRRGLLAPTPETFFQSMEYFRGLEIGKENQYQRTCGGAALIHHKPSHQCRKQH